MVRQSLSGGVFCLVPPFPPSDSVVFLKCVSLDRPGEASARMGTVLSGRTRLAPLPLRGSCGRSSPCTFILVAPGCCAPIDFYFFSCLLFLPRVALSDSLSRIFFPQRTQEARVSLYCVFCSSPSVSMGEDLQAVTSYDFCALKELNVPPSFQFQCQC